jgi:hypothetical protein
MEKFDLMVMAAMDPYFDSLMRLYSAGRLTAAQVHAAIYKPGWNISYADFYAIVSTREPELAKSMLRTDVANGELTPAEYEAITGEQYVA